MWPWCHLTYYSGICLEGLRKLWQISAGVGGFWAEIRTQVFHNMKYCQELTTYSKEGRKCRECNTEITGHVDCKSVKCPWLHYDRSVGPSCHLTASGPAGHLHPTPPFDLSSKQAQPVAVLQLVSCLDHQQTQAASLQYSSDTIEEG
jgi:hypothetical protein